MQLNRFAKFSLVSRNSALTAASVLLIAAVSLSGCSKPEKKEPEEEKPVVTEMNIQATSDESAAGSESKEDEVQTLPLESEAAEEELPELGSGG